MAMPAVPAQAALPTAMAPPRLTMQMPGAVQAPGAPGGTINRPSVAAVRIETSEAPKIDGDVSDAIWAKANVVDKFIQKSPNPGQPASERTVVRILYDSENLYFSFYNYDSQPEAILARSKIGRAHV